MFVLCLTVSVHNMQYYRSYRNEDEWDITNKYVVKVICLVRNCGVVCMKWCGVVVWYC